MRPRSPARAGRSTSIATAPSTARALAALVVCLVAGGCHEGTESSAPSEPVGEAPRDAPNVVVVVTDDQDVASLRLMPTVRRRLAARGTTFRNSYVTTPECCPSRASFLTGRYAHNHGVRSNVPPRGGFGVFDDKQTLPTALNRTGYETGFVGKYMNGYGWPALGHDPAYVPPGWSRWVAPVNHTEYQNFGYDLHIDGKVRRFGDDADDHQTDVFARQAERFVRGASREDLPFFLTVATVAPHDEGVLEAIPAGEEIPRNPRPPARHLGAFEDAELPRGPAFDEADVADKPEFVAKRERLTPERIAELETLHRSRLESLLGVDDLVRRLLRALAATGELDDTVIIFTSDNGFLLGQHRLKGKDVIYEESARVPLVIRGPGFPAAQRRQPVANIDLAPTILELTGAEPAAGMDGISLLPLARDPDRERGRSLLIEVLEGHRVAAIRRGRWIYAEYKKGDRELYDLERDPSQLVNLAGQPTSSRAESRLARELEALRSCRGGGCRGRLLE